MSIKSSVGQSLEMKAYEAGKEACTTALKGLVKPSLIIVFASSKYNQYRVLKGVREISGDIPLIGCSDSGQIVTSGPSKSGIAVMAIESDSVEFITGSGGSIDGRPRAAGSKLAKDIKNKVGDQLKLIIMLTDVLTGNGADVVRGVQDELGEDFLIFGGAAGDDFKFKETFVYLNDEVLSSSVIGVGLKGDVSIGYGVKHGWIPVGKIMKVTKSDGSVLKELDGKLAVNIYEEYFGKKAQELKEEPLARLAITYPLGMREEGSDELLIRDPITVDSKGHITCAAEIPEGSEVQIMLGSKEEAIEAARVAASDAIDQLQGKKAGAAIMFNCIARDKLFGREAIKEIQEVSKVLGGDVSIIGFYTYGEIAPFKNKSETVRSRFHNETLALLLLGD